MAGVNIPLFPICLTRDNESGRIELVSTRVIHVEVCIDDCDLWGFDFGSELFRALKPFCVNDQRFRTVFGRKYYGIAASTQVNSEVIVDSNL